MSNKVQVQYSSLRFSFACACGCMHYRDFIFVSDFCHHLLTHDAPFWHFGMLKTNQACLFSSARLCGRTSKTSQMTMRSPASTSAVCPAQCTFLAKPLFSVAEYAICARPPSYRTQTLYPSKSRISNAMTSLLKWREGGKETLLAEI